MAASKTTAIKGVLLKEKGPKNAYFVSCNLCASHDSHICLDGRMGRPHGPGHRSRNKVPDVSILPRQLVGIEGNLSVFLKSYVHREDFSSVWSWTTKQPFFASIGEATAFHP